MRPTLIRLSAQPSGWSVCRAIGRRRPVMAWAVFAEDGDRVTVGLVARGQALVRGDHLRDFEGYAAGPGTEPQLVPPALPATNLSDAMASALAVDAGTWQEYEARIRAALTASASTEWATVSLAGFELNPSRWFRLWLQARREHERTEDDLMLRLRALSTLAPGRSLADALNVAGVSLGALLASPPPHPPTNETARAGSGQGERG